MKNLLTVFLACFVWQAVFCQETVSKKELQAVRTAQKIKIDGLMDESDWQKAPVATDFFWKWPNAGNKSSLKTEVRILYDNDAVYIAAKCFDAPDSIARPLTKRDENQNCDWFGVLLDTYQDGQNALEFDVIPTNVQFDSKYSVAAANPDNGDADGEDSSWDGVWKSGTQVVADGWVVEIELPYSVLRFPKKPIQAWNINFYRRTNRHGELDCWNLNKPDQRSLPQMGRLTGIENIKAPLRLSATPFLANSFTNFHDKNASPSSTWGRQFSAGMDLKYGLNEAFTLDATVIPDFAQVRSDNEVLNLSPFEVRFDENRPFFTEGTELFNKGGLFYSRRIGNRPLHFEDVEDQLKDGEVVENNPSAVRLLNATKISGRTKSGTGIGMFNAIEGATFATVKNEETGAVRDIQTSSLTDKSVVVIDQNLPHNSYATFINTAALRSGSDVDADVSGLTFNLRDKKNLYSLYGNGYLSQRFFSANSLGKDSVSRGHNWGLNFEKNSGTWQWHVGVNEESAHYNPNDLGFLYSPNEQSSLVWVSYNQFKPKGNWNNWWASTWNWTGRYYAPKVFNSSAFGFNMGGNRKNFQNGGMNLQITPWGEHDYFEPRTEDFKRYFNILPSGRFNYWYNTDHRKTWQLNQGQSFRYRKGYGGRFGYATWLNLSWRISKKLTLRTGLELNYTKNDVGFSGANESSVGYASLLLPDGSQDPEKIVFGTRNIYGYDNGLDFNFTFNTKMNLALRVRHYWNRVKYTSFHLLADDGGLAPTAYEGHDAQGNALHNITANFFNIDCIYTWRFAPGSDVLLVWKNSVADENSTVSDGYLHGLGEVPTLPMLNSISIKILYYLDYAAVKKRLN